MRFTDIPNRIGNFVEQIRPTSTYTGWGFTRRIERRTRGNQPSHIHAAVSTQLAVHTVTNISGYSVPLSYSEEVGISYTHHVAGRRDITYYQRITTRSLNALPLSEDIDQREKVNARFTRRIDRIRDRVPNIVITANPPLIV